MVTVGVFDSGIGGLSVLREICAKTSAGRIIYLADNANHPYGELEAGVMREICSNIVQRFIDMGAGVVVVACNTASGAALYSLRQEFEGIKFVGMEPAIKPACQKTISKKVAVLATSGTLRAEPYALVVERFAGGVELFELPCKGLAAAIESGSAEIEPLLREYLEPVLDAGVDQVALACTHYPLVHDIIATICAGKAEIIDPAAAIARQLERVIDTDHASGGCEVEYFASANVQQLQRGVKQYIGHDVVVNKWQ